VQAAIGLQGDSVIVATACSAGNYAIGYAFDKIRSGAVEIALCGGSDVQCLKNFGGFFRIGALAPEKCQPFDRDRKGILPGEGAGVLVLESLDRAQARGAEILAEVLGYGTSCDGTHIMSPDKDGIVACALDALQRSGVRPEQVDYICAHGTGTPANDVVETAAMREVFGDSLPPMSGIKSMLGHTMGAASALSAIACVLSLKHGFLPPTIHFSTPDPECTLDCVPNRSRAAKPRIAQNNAFAFGGNNAIVLFKRWS
jgi:3-oxoacyl-[acyl-carrier-protein] synthase II